MFADQMQIMLNLLQYWGEIIREKFTHSIKFLLLFLQVSWFVWIAFRLFSWCQSEWTWYDEATANVFHEELSFSVFKT